MNRLVAAFLAADSPRASGIARLTNGAVVFALSKGPANGMNGRQIQDIKTQIHDVRQPGLDIAKGPVLALGAPGAWKQLIPGAEAGSLRIDLNQQRFLINAGEARLGKHLDQSGQLIILGQANSCFRSEEHTSEL